MKRVFASILMLFIAQLSFAQKSDSTFIPQHDFKYYSTKRNHYNTAGWICLGGGATMVALGGLDAFAGTINNALAGTHNSNTNTGVAIAVIGEVAALSSIPLFIVAHHNKKMAHLAFRRESVTINNKPINTTGYTAVAFTISF